MNIVIVRGGVAETISGEVKILDMDNLSAGECPNCFEELGDEGYYCPECKIDWTNASTEEMVSKIGNKEIGDSRDKAVTAVVKVLSRIMMGPNVILRDGARKDVEAMVDAIIDASKKSRGS